MTPVDRVPWQDICDVLAATRSIGKVDPVLVYRRSDGEYWSEVITRDGMNIHYYKRLSEFSLVWAIGIAGVTIVNALVTVNTPRSEIGR